MGEITAHYARRDTSHQYFDDRFDIISTLGRGRSSIVYKAVKFSRDGTIDIDSPPVAVKVLRNIDGRDADALIRKIKRESLALLSCVHPHVIRLHDYVARKDLCYLTLEYAEFGDLKKLFSSKEKFLSPRATLKLVQNILSGVSAIHHAGIVHRDIKPENILLTHEYQVKICDFSVCLLQGESPSIQLVSNIVGTIDYLAPESLRGGGYSYLSDIYSVAVTCYELLHGSLPFEDSSFNNSLLRKDTCAFTVNDDLKAEFPTVVDFFKKALAPDPSQRFQTAEEMSIGIDQVLSSTFRITEQEQILKEEKIPSVHFFRTLSSEKISRALKRVSRFYIVSFLITLALFYALSIGKTQLPKQQHSRNVSKSQNVSGMQSTDLLKNSLTKKPAMGVIKDLYKKDKRYRFIITPINEEKALFSLLVLGWEPVEISLSGLQENHPYRIHGRGLDILVRFTSTNDNNSWQGKFENLLTGTEGSLDLKIVDE